MLVQSTPASAALSAPASLTAPEDEPLLLELAPELLDVPAPELLLDAAPLLELPLELPAPELPLPELDEPEDAPLLLEDFPPLLPEPLDDPWPPPLELPELLLLPFEPPGVESPLEPQAESK